MTFIIGLLARLVGPKLAKPMLWALLVIAAIGGARMAVHWVQADARKTLLIEQAAERAAAADAQRQIEADAAAVRHRELNDGTARDRNTQEGLTNATRHLEETRLSARQRARICAELQQQSAAKRLPSPAC